MILKKRGEINSGNKGDKFIFLKDQKLDDHFPIVESLGSRIIPYCKY